MVTNSASRASKNAPACCIADLHTPRYSPRGGASRLNTGAGIRNSRINLLKMTKTAFPDEDLFLMSNLSPKKTGLPFVVWISPKGGAKHDIRVKISRGPNATPSEMRTVALRPDLHVIGKGDLAPRERDLLREWVKLNFDALLAFWEGGIEYTEDVLDILRPVPAKP